MFHTVRYDEFNNFYQKWRDPELEKVCLISWFRKIVQRLLNTYKVFQCDLVTKAKPKRYTYFFVNLHIRSHKDRYYERKLRSISWQLELGEATSQCSVHVYYMFALSYIVMYAPLECLQEEHTSCIALSSTICIFWHFFFASNKHGVSQSMFW